MADTRTEGDGDTVEEASAHTLVTFRVPVDALGLTHQSLSERIRRGHQALTESTSFERSRRY